MTLLDDNQYFDLLDYILGLRFKLSECVEAENSIMIMGHQMSPRSSCEDQEEEKVPIGHKRKLKFDEFESFSDSDKDDVGLDVLEKRIQLELKEIEKLEGKH